VAFVTSALVLVLAGLVLPSQRPPLQEERFNWFATHSTTVGQHLAIAVALAAVFVACSAAYRLPANRWLLSSGALAALIAALAANHTRGALVAAGLAAAVGVLAMVPARWRPSLAAAGVWAVASAAVGASAAFASWFARGDSVEQIATLNARTGLWRVAASGTFAEDPFFGLGTGASRSVFVAQTGLGGGHNAALNVFVDGGLVALLLWAGLVLGVVVALMRPGSAARGTDMQERLAYAAACAACTAVLVSAAVHEGLGAPAGTAVTWLAMTVAYLGSAARTRRQPSRPGTGCPPVPAEGVMLRSDTPATAGRHP
jgi:O-antigen ligase